MKKKKRLKTKNIIKLVAGILVIYLIIKIACLLIFQVRSDEYKQLLKNYEFTKTITIQKQNSDNLLRFNNLAIRNDFTSFQLLEDTNVYSDQYVLYDENNEIKAALILALQETTTTLAKNYKYFYEVDDWRTNSDVVKNYLDKKNIFNDLQLIDYLKEINFEKKTNIFTSISEIRRSFYLNYMMYMLLPKVNTLYKIEGDYKGYVYVLDNLLQVNILSDDRAYTYSFIGREFFTDEYINELLNTIRVG